MRSESELEGSKSRLEGSESGLEVMERCSYCQAIAASWACL